jgi:diguanylate cyclase (GGDEF)-like protein
MNVDHRPLPAGKHAPGQALAAALMRAAEPAQVARALLDGARLPAGCRVVWSHEWPHALESHPPDPGNGLPAGIVEAVAAARSLPAGSESDPGVRILHDDGDRRVAALHCPGGCPPPSDEDIATAGLRMSEVLAVRDLQSAVARLEQAERLQRALYAIADLAGSDLDMQDMLRSLHRIVSDLMYAENFYIALYDAPSDSLRFLYFVDLVDQEGPGPDEVIPLARIQHGLSWHLVRGRKPLMGSMEELASQVASPLQLHGADSFDWLGVPMIREGEVRGIVVVQSYENIRRYTRAEMSLLAFVAEHILTALERRQGREELENRVHERTASLAEANLELRREVEERERSERLQAALYRIAAVAGSEGSSERFYREVHDSVARLLYARNFYIALVSDDGRMVSFPYAADQFERDWSPRAYGRGLTEFVLRTNQAQLVDVDRARQLITAGEIDAGMLGAPTLVWLGVPLPGEDGPIGVIAVQNYENSAGYTEGDVELMTFAASQIANSLLRRRSAELLRRANTELERRVEVRTAELRQQIAVRERIEAQLKHQVMHDALTGLPNRTYLRDRIERALARLRRDPGQGFGLLYVDVDRFKLLNDSLGHQAGDTVLVEFAARLAHCVREPDVVARLAGDEFAILLEQVQMPETASKVAQRVMQSMGPPFTVGDRELQVGTSIGIAIVDARYASADQILHDADLALYRAKEGGRGRFEMFDEVMQHSAMDALDLEQGLRRALARMEFEPWLQPLVRMSDGMIVGYEALLRWRHPERGLLAPGDFLRVAEDSGLIEEIDWQAYRLALDQARDLVSGDRFLSLNVSPRMFRHRGFDERLLALARDAGFDAARLRLEVTEGMLLRDPEHVIAMLQRLKGAGVDAALDDFGTGYSSLSHVHRFPLKAIKIDRSFVTPLAGNGDTPRSAAVIEAILALGRALDIEIVAEGIETAEQRDALLGLGCELGQGYLFGRPQPAAHWREGQAH